MESSSWKKLSATPKNLFKNYLEKYVTMLQDTKGSHELGYAAVKKPRPETASNPTITPSAVTFSNLAFIGPDGKEFISASDAEGGGDNMLVYLQTVRRENFFLVLLLICHSRFDLRRPRKDFQRMRCHHQ